MSGEYDHHNETAPALRTRRAGILLHPTSLPGGVGNGELGQEAYHFIDFLVSTGCTVWQTLPMGPTHGNGSPYQSTSAHAGNTLLISLDKLADEGWLTPDYSWVSKVESPAYRHARLKEARRNFVKAAREEDREAYRDFLARHADWLEDYVLYEALKKENDRQPWRLWPEPLRNRDPEAIQEARGRLVEMMEQHRFEQFLFFRQWGQLKQYANERGVYMFGDVPIFVSDDSAEVWAQRGYFKVGADGRPSVVAGVPPDYFSATGQRWGNPHYNWDAIAREGFRWWIDRIERQLELFDLIRIDHFRGFESHWEIDANEETAINGRWVKAPGVELFEALFSHFGPLPLVAEDLGSITREVDDLRKRFSLPGMKVLQFAFDGGPDNPYLPHNHHSDFVVYTGTHDNDTTVGWWSQLPEHAQANVMEYLGHPQEPMPWPIIRAALRSVARLAVIPMQDVIGLGSDCRMNTPGTTDGNWSWRFEWDQLGAENAARLGRLVRQYGR